jgi:hypothetical protein
LAQGKAAFAGGHPGGHPGGVQRPDPLRRLGGRAVCNDRPVLDRDFPNSRAVTRADAPTAVTAHL